jgi:cytochrome c oxidase subunit 4
MSVSATHQDELPDDLHADHEHAHPTQLFYIKIALLLAAITALEVLASYWGPLTDHNALLIAVLAPMMIIKFVVVAMFFMHLRFDSRWFRRVFIAGIILAVTVYTVVFATFHFSSVQNHVQL